MDNWKNFYVCYSLNEKELERLQKIADKRNMTVESCFQSIMALDSTKLIEERFSREEQQ